MTKTIPPIPQENQSHKGPGSAPSVPLDTTKGHRDDEKNNIREQAEHRNMNSEHQQPPVGVRGARSISNVKQRGTLSPSLRGAKRRSNPWLHCSVRWIASLRSQ